MQASIFILLSIVYIISLALIDGLFNRLVFKEIKTLPYGTKEKLEIYRLPEWKYIGVIFLIVLPILVPSVVSFYIGGWYYLGVYWLLLLLIQWDMIFGKLVFGKWFGDSPSICLPYFGWLQFDIKLVILIRLICAGVILFYLV